MSKLYFTLLLFFSFSTINAQIVPTEGTTQCFLAGNGGTFQDIGGAGDYPDCNCVTTTTICGVDGSAVTIDFTAFGINEPFDWLVILDTDNQMGEEFPMGPQLFNNSDGDGDGGADNYGLGADAGVGTLGELTSTSFTATNANGCLTLVFRSSAVVADAGWDANITVAGGAGHPGDDFDCSDNIDCLPPGNVTLDNLTATSIDLSWSEVANAGSYNVEYGATGFTPGMGTGTLENTTNLSLGLTGLQENTNYDIYFQTDCSADGTSNYVGPFTITTPFINPPVTCVYTLNLFDSFGDGWNGSILTATVNGVSTDYTIPAGGDMATFEVTALSNFPLVFNYTAGAFQNEVTYEILDPSGVVIFMDGPNPATGEVLSIFACPTCPGPSMFSVIEAGGIDADLAWSPADSSGVYIVEYGPSGFIPGTGTSITTNNTELTITGLIENTAYDVYISVDCDNGDMSAPLGPVSFQTIWLIDAGVVAIHSPESQCGLTNNEVVEVTLRNFGDSPLSLIPFKYSVNNIDAGVPIPLDGYYTGVISNDSTIRLEFETTFDFSEAGEYTIVAWTELEGDGDSSNDTTIITVTNIPIVDEYPYFTNFEDWDGGWKVDDENSTNGTWAFGMPNGADISTAASGVNAFVTNLDGNYNNNELSYFVSPCYDFSSLTDDPIINLAINYDTETNWDGAWLEASIDGGMNWAKVGSIGTGVNWYTIDNNTQQLGDVWAGNSGGWINAENTLTGLAGESNCRFRFAFDSDGSVNGFDGVGIDNILISPVFSDDLSTLSANHTTDSDCGSEMDQVVVEIRNAGTETQFNFDVSYQVNGGTIVTENVGALSILPGDIEMYTFTTPFNSNAFGADFEIKAWTNLMDELNFINDSAAYVFSTIEPDALPLVEDFEDFMFPDGWENTDGIVGNGHNNTSVVIYDNMFSGDTDFEFTTSNIGPINPGDSLTFDYRYTNWSAGTVATELAGDMLEIQISTDCGESYNTVFVIDQANHTPSAVMTNRLIDLDTYAGEVIRIRFFATWASGDYWLDIDNINIIGCPQSLALDAVTLFESSTGAGDGAIIVNPEQGQGPYTYDWDDANAPDDLSAGTYTATVTDANGCMDVITVEIGVCPESLGLGVEVSNVTVEGNSDGKVTIAPESGTGPYEYDWSNGDSTAVISDLPAGEYIVTVTDVNGCMDELSVTVDIGVGFEDLDKIDEVSLVPNPTSGISTLSISLKETANIRVQLLSVVGQLLLERESNLTTSETYELDLSDFAGGMYFVRIMVDNQPYVEKLIKTE